MVVKITPPVRYGVAKRLEMNFLENPHTVPATFDGLPSTCASVGVAVQHCVCWR